MDGIFYVINQLGLALSQANARIAQLEKALTDAGVASQTDLPPND